MPAERAHEIVVEYFAAARELCGLASERLPFVSGDLPAREVLQLLAARHPRLAPHLTRMRLCINDELVSADARVRSGDRVGVLPPVAGGAPLLCELRQERLSVDEAMAAVAHPSAGGIALFVGVVRDHADGLPVSRLDYEAHPTLAQRELLRIVTEIMAAHPEVRLAALHRVGQLAVGDVAVVIAASAAHRAEAFDVCRLAIDRIKASVPIWKKEWDHDGEAHWVNLTQ